MLGNSINTAATSKSINPNKRYQQFAIEDNGPIILLPYWVRATLESKKQNISILENKAKIEKHLSLDMISDLLLYNKFANTYLSYPVIKTLAYNTYKDIVDNNTVKKVASIADYPRAAMLAQKYFTVMTHEEPYNLDIINHSKLVITMNDSFGIILHGDNKKKLNFLMDVVDKLLKIRTIDQVASTNAMREYVFLVENTYETNRG